MTSTGPAATGSDADAVEAALAFSGHRFDDAAPFLHADVLWVGYGSGDLGGRDAVLSACAETAQHLLTTTTELQHHRAVVGADGVAVDTVTRYTGEDGEGSTIASCDLYVVADGLITEIRSYTVELA
jgi:ketosteroid isomerase-like protein